MRLFVVVALVSLLAGCSSRERGSARSENRYEAIIVRDRLVPIRGLSLLGSNLSKRNEEGTTALFRIAIQGNYVAPAPGWRLFFNGTVIPTDPRGYFRVYLRLKDRQTVVDVLAVGLSRDQVEREKLRISLPPIEDADW